MLSFVFLLSGCSPVAQNPPSASFYFVADTPVGFRLFSEERDIEATAEDLATEAISQLVSGAIQPLDPDYVNLWDQSTSLNSLTVEGSEAVVDLDFGNLNVGAEAEARAIDQVVWTLTAILPEVESVRFLVNGEVVESLDGHLDASMSFSRGNDFDVLSNVQISSINQKAQLTSQVTIQGEACTFEANVAWVLYQGGNVINQGATLAEQACPVRSTWQIELGELEEGDYQLEVFETSAKDGSKIALDNKDFSDE